jgi:hypothetical protein
MIAVVGEALIDLVVDDAGEVAARPGGTGPRAQRARGRRR